MPLDQADAQAIPLEGRLSDPSTLPRLYAWLARGAWSGLVLVRTGDVERRIYFADGRITTAGSTEQSDNLASWLIREGLLTEEDRSRVAGQLRTPDRGWSFGRQLVRLGLVTERDLQRVERRRVVGIAVQTLSIRTGQYACEAGQVAGDAQPPQGLEVARIVAEGVLASWDANSALEALGGEDAVLAMVPEALADYEATGADEPYDMTLLLCNGRRSVREILEQAPLPGTAALRFLAAVRLLGTVTSTPGAPRPAAAQGAAAGEAVAWPATPLLREPDLDSTAPSGRAAGLADGERLDVAEAGERAASPASTAGMPEPSEAGSARGGERPAGPQPPPPPPSPPAKPARARPARAAAARPEARSASWGARTWILVAVIAVLVAGLGYVAYRGWNEVTRPPAGAGAP